jgi:3-methyladenine DNA glycosylase AlkD
MTELQQIQKTLRAKASPARAKICARFFKTGPGEYGAGDIFLGLTVPEQRTIAKKFYSLSLSAIQKLLTSKIHEERFTALIILVYQFTHPNRAYVNTPLQQQKRIYNFYLKNARRINSWDLVDTSAPYIVGEHLITDKSPLAEGWREVLEKLARSTNLWERRIAILSTFPFIRNRQPEPTFTIAQMLLNDTHDLIHKAAGWMLREVGKNCGEEKLEQFLERHAKEMPRTMLRYAVERLPEKDRKKFMQAH